MDQHSQFIRRAIELARLARQHGNHPFGALLVFPAIEPGKLANDSFCGPCADLFSRSQEHTGVVGPILPAEGQQVHAGFWTNNDVPADQQGPFNFYRRRR